MLNTKFKLKSEYKPAGDQPKAILELIKGLEKGHKKQTLLGVTGSGKTFTMANVIEKIQKPTLVIAHNKTLAAQLAQEYKTFFPENAVHYFVSYYDYYQPEAYMPTTDTYIEKDAKINEEIDRLRHASTQALLTRHDVIIVASVSCIYGLGSPEEYSEENLFLEKGQKIIRNDILKRLIELYFERTNTDLKSGQFRATGSKIEIMPVSETFVYSILLGSDSTIKNIFKIDPISSKVLDNPKNIFLFPAKHFLTSKDKRNKAIKLIKLELETQLKKFKKEGKLLEAERLKRRTNYDLTMLKEFGYCNGIENYSRHLSGRREGAPPDTLLSYFPDDFLTIIDESHVSVPQIGGMYAGDQSRKKTLIEHGFRLPSAADNRPLRFEEFDKKVKQVIFTSATPAEYEREISGQIVEQIIRPTGLIDPEIEIKPVSQQVQDFIAESAKEIKKGGRVIATTLTKKMAEDLSAYLKDQKIKAEYLHSDIKTLERIKILTDFRRGKFDCLVGVNLLREGLDLPEVTLIGILDADKEGFLRSETSLIQIIGRAARNVLGRVILYADNITGSIQKAVGETNRRRKIQMDYNKKHKITPKTIIKKIHDITEEMESLHEKAVKAELNFDAKFFARNPAKLIKLKEREMGEAVKELDFETAAILRDEIKILKEKSEK
ncbi:excinuclease ABC subunit B [Candidatus Nomurabacteria bacterium RIFCSPHIGHO2_01_FULL_39_9]|uniref:UvrABC system protein B n=1 Tax=Candidatus Nomurabacteria bacterium RIFCSPHIGHO2_01_FULL_39_9 TaxID=1801735 RepID=A0A1F6UVI5_9BACT|nr:MAG: excinuclease ABC subunit B [Candidatus Nomurabacteria bacterium RIFCSPHIGHO2_01_FULL_39_9]